MNRAYKSDRNSLVKQFKAMSKEISKTVASLKGDIVSLAAQNKIGIEENKERVSLHDEELAGAKEEREEMKASISKLKSEMEDQKRGRSRRLVFRMIKC